ncbi:MAG: Plug domain-containing protein, partial [Prolixibacteraceae bacterium]|nr:Plug domain-containing protein [Prolixibacteraceae bacterium]
MRKIMFILLSFLSAYCLHAEEPAPAVMDSVLLDEIITYSDYRKFQPGAKFDLINIEEHSNSHANSIDQLIMLNSPIYIKTNAGGLATIRIRGTAPDHTSINIGGINLNSLTLGHSNISSVPTFMFDQIDIQYGSSSTLNGSGSIGGAVYLRQKN